MRTWICIVLLFSLVLTNSFGFVGRIAYSADGNHNDPDDWIASPVTLAILAEAGLKERLVHFDYNCILPQTDPQWEKTHAESVLGAAERYGFDKSVFFDCRKDLDGAIASIAKAINDSTADNPLYFIIAGPMEVAYRGIQKSDPAKRKFVWCISHSRWNDGFASKYKFTFTKRSVIEQDIRWVQIADQNRLLSCSRFGKPAAPEQFQPYFWMRDSADAKVRWLWERMLVSTRPDPSDAGMTWFVATGDEECTPDKLKALIEEHRPPPRISARQQVRIEAENFRHLEGFVLEDRDAKASHRLNVKLAGATTGRIRTRFDEPFTSDDGHYDVDIRYLAASDGQSRFRFLLNGAPVGAEWTGAAGQWATHTIADVPIKRGDELTVEARQGGKLDYVQLNSRGATPAASAPATAAKLDDPAAMPGQVIVDPSNPRWLKKNGGQRLFLFGCGNPEEFFFLGKRQPDGTRIGGRQSEIIKRIAGTGANTFHLLAMRDSRYNLEPGNGAPDANPFENADINGKLDEDILNQWEGWLREFEAADIIVLFTFYNDFDDLEDKAGWKLDANGNLHPQEKYFIEALVNKFKHHKNIIWAIEESCNKLSRAKQRRLIKVAERVAQTDPFHHPIAQMFQVLYYDEVHPDKVGPEDYANSPVKIMTWGHYSTPQKGLPPPERYYQELVAHWKEAAGRYVLINTEVDKHPSAGAASRLYCWTSAMANFYTMVNSHRPDKPKVPRETYLDDGRIRAFMERTDFHRMSPRSELKLGSTLYVLANEPTSYIAYGHDATAPMGIRKMQAGQYDLWWFDTVTGRSVTERHVRVAGGDTTWPKPDSLGTELALYVVKTTP